MTADINNKNKEKFVVNALKSIGASDLTIKNSVELIRTLIYFDPYEITNFEFSFKVKGDQVSNTARVLNMDADAYSCRNQKFFEARLGLFDDILRPKSGKNAKAAIGALKALGEFPMDLYFGFDVNDSEYLFAFWLIFGGVNKQGEKSFWAYDFKKIVSGLLKTAGLKQAPILSSKILNFGFDLGREVTKYKLYYLYEGKTRPVADFNNLVAAIDDQLRDYKYFYFFSQMFDENAKLIKEKLFIEFLENIYTADEPKIKHILETIAAKNKYKFNYLKIIHILKNCGGRLCLISFEPDGYLTFYLRLY